MNTARLWLKLGAALALANVGLAVSMPAPAAADDFCGVAYDCACKYFLSEWGCFQEMEPVELNCVSQGECL